LSLSRCLYHTTGPFKAFSKIEAGKGEFLPPSLPGFLQTPVERVTLVYEGGTRNVKKKQWLEETRVPMAWGSDPTCMQVSRVAPSIIEETKSQLPIVKIRASVIRG
jgi:hypothetical protein